MFHTSSSLPLVSIIIPIFNVEKYIAQCIKSVLTQTYHNLEILCIDDRSTDNSIATLLPFLVEDNRIRLIRHQHNLGLGAARNSGIKESNGEFIYFLDSDDWLQSKTIETLVKKAISERADIVIGSSLAFPDTDSMSLKRISKSMNKWLKLDNIPSKISTRSFYFALEKIPCIACNKLFRSSFLLKNNLHFINRKIKHEDTGFHIKCMACNPRLSKSDNIDAKYQYRIRSASLMDFENNIRDESIRDAKIALDDALYFLDYSHKNPTYRQIVKDVHWTYFASKFIFITFYWGSFFKILRIGRISVFKQAFRNNRYNFYFLGIPLWKHNANHMS
mgnify:CR=1 FL=1